MALPPRSRLVVRIAASMAPCAGALAFAGHAQAVPTASPGFTLTTFATAPVGSSAPDSIAVVGNDVYVGYGNGGAPDGSGGATSTIAEYTRSGSFVGTTTVTGHNDGLRYDPNTGKLWAIQNEDANPNLVLITPGTLAQSTPYSFSATPHGGGYDDVAFLHGQAFVSASNPATNPNNAPALLSASLGVGTVTVSGVLNGTASATVINTGGSTKLNLQDPDSLSVTPDGRIALDSQGDQQLVFISNPNTSGQSVSVLNLTNQIDDTMFAGSGQRALLFAAKGDNTVYELLGNFAPGTAWSAAASNTAPGVDDFIGELNLTDGSLSPVVTGLNNPGGEAFLPVGEPASLTLLFGSIAAIVPFARRRRIATPAT